MSLDRPGQADLTTTRRFLSLLAALPAAGPPPEADRLPDAEALASWAARHDLEGLAYAWLRGSRTEAARRLRREAFSSAAANLAHFDNLRRIEKSFFGAGLPMVLLKGAALAGAVYGDPALRSMSDIDIWVRASDMDRAMALMEGLGFSRLEPPRRRPAELQRMAGGEVRFRSADGTLGLVELHWSPFPGWWMRRTARVDPEAVWKRSEPVAPGRHARRLCREDTVLQVALHIVGSQFLESPLRGLMDIAVMARAWPLDWVRASERARAWRVATALWLVLDLADSLIGAREVRTAARRLRPSFLREQLLRRLVTPESLLFGAGPVSSRARYLLLLLLVDRSRDVLGIVSRTLWPEKRWLSARYGRPISRARHLWLVLGRGEV